MHLCVVTFTFIRKVASLVVIPHCIYISAARIRGELYRFETNQYLSLLILLRSIYTIRPHHLSHPMGYSKAHLNKLNKRTHDN